MLSRCIALLLALALLCHGAAAGLFGRKKTEEEAQDGAFAARRGVEYMRDAAGNTNELRETLKMLEDPAVMREVQEMMRDPKFQAEMEKLTSDPRFKASVQQANELLGETAAADMLADPSVYEQYLRMFSSEKENVARGIKHMHQALADPQEMKAAMDLLNDPDTRAEVERMMNDPDFRREMEQYTSGADFQAAMKKARKQVDEIMKDPKLVQELHSQMRELMA
uniref:STI1 domain-containing protein n=1 Tax=Pinguiococcus pyrenoidosus TaxID=172671 RepID=A0A7R9U7W1_9STRA|mmetsp:Transcript_1831/g.8033  ORF Transcript_1831/g.8033 Transcript_1831/m.8033 type:complete len:224 (+) Transcript_1831:433-1104(+)